MSKIPLATQIPKTLKAEVDAVCEQRGCSLSHLTTEALREKMDSLREDEALISLALARLAEPGEHSYTEYRRRMRRRRKS